MNTPDNITTLAPNEIFVFGSNLSGRHVGGAAAYAKQNFGAKEGVHEGMTGQCYAFPTLGRNLKKRTDDLLTMSVIRFFTLARRYPEKTFLVTRVGCGIAGYDEDNIKQLFRKPPSNVVLPRGWQ